MTEIEALIVRQEIPMLGKLIGTSYADGAAAARRLRRDAVRQDGRDACERSARRGALSAIKLAQTGQTYVHALTDSRRQRRRETSKTC